MLHCILFNSLGPSDTIWRQRFGSTLAQVMACCLTAPSHYGAWNNVDLSSVRSRIIHLRASSQEIPQPLITEIIWKIKYLKCHSNFPGTNELNILVWTQRVKPGFMHALGNTPTLNLVLRGSLDHRTVSRSVGSQNGADPGSLGLSGAPDTGPWTP